MNHVVLDDVNTSTLVLTAVADDVMPLLNACVDGLGVAVLEILEKVDDVNTSVLAALVAEDDAVLLEAVADADVEVLVPPAVLVDAVSATVEGSGVLVCRVTALAVRDVDRDELLDSARAEVLVGTGGVGVAVPVILEVVDDVNTSVVAALVAENDVLLLEVTANADVEVLVPPAVLVNAVHATVEGSGVLVFTTHAVLDVDGDELLDSARAEVLIGTGVDVAMNPVVLDNVNASTLVLTAVADDDTLLLNTCVDGVGVAVLVSGTGSNASAMIEVLAGTDPESDVADAGTVMVSSVGDVAATTNLLRVIIYPPPLQRQQPALITVHTNATVMDILNKATTLFRISPESVGAHYLSFGTRNSHDPAST